ncbi:MAG: hypothetical protein K2N88_07725 [Muribaculaceae bacterium]|nr:hypothetical protein [Muribaculaceae bacterium]
MKRHGNGRIVMRADAGESIGFGHFVRSAALAGYLRNDFECLLTTHNPSGPLLPFQKRLAEENGATLVALDGPGRQGVDKHFLSLLQEGDIAVLDNYFYTTDYQRQVRAKCGRLVHIDDMHDRHFVADLLITVCPLEASEFSMEPFTRFLGGVDYTFLRAPFLAPAIRRDGIRISRRMVLAIGGADPLRLTDKMIRVVRAVSPEIHIDVIAGATVEILSPEGEHLTIWRQLTAEEIVRIFDEADWGIFPASTVCIEAMARKLPVLAGYYVDNQEEFYARGVERGWFGAMGNLSDDEHALTERLRAQLENAAGIKESPGFNFIEKKREITEAFLNLKNSPLTTLPK